MTSISNPEQPNQELDEVIEQIAIAIAAGEPVDLDRYAAEFPRYADQLRSYVLSMQLLADFGDLDSRANTHLVTDAVDLPNRVLGDYRLLRELGRGGMGVVYEAEQPSLSRRVALKVLPFAAVLDSQRLQRFKNEAVAAASLDHPNIVSVYSVGCDRGVHYFAMQLIEGQSLAEAIQLPQPKTSSADDGNPSQGSTSPTTQTVAKASTVEWQSLGKRASGRAAYVARLGIQAAEALEHAHQVGIIHRDVKPANLMIDANGKLWVTDFGLAHVTTDSQLTMSGRFTRYSSIHESGTSYRTRRDRSPYRCLFTGGSIIRTAEWSPCL